MSNGLKRRGIAARGHSGARRRGRARRLQSLACTISRSCRLSTPQRVGGKERRLHFAQRRPREVPTPPSACSSRGDHLRFSSPSSLAVHPSPILPLLLSATDSRSERDPVHPTAGNTKPTSPPRRNPPLPLLAFTVSISGTAGQPAFHQDRKFGALTSAALDEAALHTSIDTRPTCCTIRHQRRQPSLECHLCPFPVLPRRRDHFTGVRTSRRVCSHEPSRKIEALRVPR